MTKGWFLRSGRRTALAFAAVIFVIATGVASSAFGAEQTIVVGGDVFQEKCVPCHANIADSKANSDIIFKHAYHLLIACSSCHTSFPHAPSGTTKPTMKGCWACHDLRHGPQGLLATGECDGKCHRSPRTLRRPAFHIWNWAEKPHVAMGRSQYRTKCMMCHTQKQCDDCHARKNVSWTPTEPSTYDPQNDCQVCHGQQTLQKMSGTGVQSFQVLGVSDSTHAKVGCIDCHRDFKYNDAPDATKIWRVNAGLGCRDCHQGKVAKFASQVATWTVKVSAYDQSIHAQKLNDGNMDSATCSSCHGGHDISRLDTPGTRAALHQSAYRVCARCHPKQYRSYDDYYHGAAYKKGAGDAPACWDCHDSHNILPASDPSSAVSAESLPKTCGGSKAGRTCHENVTPGFTENAGSLIHQKVKVKNENPVSVFVSWIASRF